MELSPSLPVAIHCWVSLCRSGSLYNVFLDLKDVAHHTIARPNWWTGSEEWRPRSGLRRLVGWTLFWHAVVLSFNAGSFLAASVRLHCLLCLRG